jgi:hypothetical protein
LRIDVIEAFGDISIQSPFGLAVYREEYGFDSIMT